jgi:polyisoprenoid-binding protein YceI
MSTAVQPFTGAFVADRDHSSFQATLRHMGVGTFRTGFSDVDARLALAGGTYRLEGSAAVASIDITRPAEFRAHVVEGREFFDARHHPEIRFASTAMTFGSDETVAIAGTLTMRGIERAIEARGTFRGPVDDLYGGRRAALDLAATIDRRHWGMDFQAPLPGGGDVLSWTVDLSVHLELVEAG